MKKLLLASLFVIALAGTANASDGGVYIESSNVYSGTSDYTRTEYVAPAPRTTARRVVTGHRPCGCTHRATVTAVAVRPAPVAVKTYSEVIDHYQVYQPVVSYVPAGTYTQRRMVSNVRPCGM
ncbi:hypothetical protein HDR61_04885 [bacterium]|nr:hypothetical protein [bacterium]